LRGEDAVFKNTDVLHAAATPGEVLREDVRATEEQKDAMAEARGWE
jgi:hypothetical protein